MSIDILGKNIIGFIILLVLQILVFNNIGISSLNIIPVFFILFILMLPFETPKWLILLSAFILGILIDIFSDTSGLNASATVLIAFIRPLVLQYISPRGGYDTGTSPRVQDMGFSWFLKYASVLIFVHQFAFYFLENFSFSNFFYILTKIIIGTIISLILIIIAQFILYRK